MAAGEVDRGGAEPGLRPPGVGPDWGEPGPEARSVLLSGWGGRCEGHWRGGAKAQQCPRCRVWLLQPRGVGQAARTPGERPGWLLFPARPLGLSGQSPSLG